MIKAIINDRLFESLDILSQDLFFISDNSKEDKDIFSLLSVLKVVHWESYQDKNISVYLVQKSLSSWHVAVISPLNFEGREGRELFMELDDVFNSSEHLDHWDEIKEKLSEEKNYLSAHLQLNK